MEKSAEDGEPGDIASRGTSGWDASGRYEHVALLGKGGMAAVHEVRDRRTGRHVAMKRLLPQEDAERRVKARRLFEREYQTLSQLKHPRIVEVYDYSIDSSGAYYTMELLSGGDLSQLVPMDPVRACRFAKDVCSALSLLHSRSRVHRDVSARNVRCTAEGGAKLIDFGAMAPIGQNRNGIVGTPSYSAPEILSGGVLDARTDLYSLGATLYYVLTGRHAYPAKDFEALRERWQLACPHPSEYAPGIPPSLDALVMELLRLDALARPSSAFEVIERLCAIDQTPFDEQLGVAKAYLATPVLTGRDASLAAVRRSLRRVDKGQARALVVTGPSGVGRSRFLAAAVLEAKLRGAIIVQANAHDGREGDYGVVRALARRLIEETDGGARDAIGDAGPILRSVVPGLAAAEATAMDEPEPARHAVQRALGDWFARVARQRRLALVVDDFHGIDEGSAAALSVLAHGLDRPGLAMLLSVDTTATPLARAATKLLVDSSEIVQLSPLTHELSEELLRSVFGNGPDIGLLAHRIHGLAAGNPRDTLELAQHLVEERTIRYERGAWSVPGAFDARRLPATMAQALEARVAALSPGAREVARALSLAAGQTITLEEVGLLGSASVAEAPAAVLDELLRAHVLRASGDRYGLSQEAWARALQRELSADERRALNMRVAEMFRHRGAEEFRYGRHLLLGGDTERGLDVLIAHAAASQEQTNRSAETFFKYTMALPPDWLEIYERAIELCEETNRSKRDIYALRTRLCGIIAIADRRDVTHLPALMRELADYTGLAGYHAMDPSLPPEQRLRGAMRAVQERYAATPERDRVIEPKLALRQLGRVCVQTGALITAALDAEYLRSLPSLSPLSALSPAFGVVQMLFDGMASRYAGRLEESRARYLKLMERLTAPDGGGLDGSHNGYMCLGVANGIGMLEAGMGLASTLEWAEKLERIPNGRVNAVQIRALYHLWQGNVAEADRLRRHVELLRIQDSPRQLFEGTHLLFQISAHGLSDDLTHLKHALDELEGLASRFPGWKPVQHYGAAEYHRAGGAYDAALSEFEAALSLTSAGEHQIWAFLAGAHLRTLDDLGRASEAVRVGQEYLLAAENVRLGYVTSYILMPLAIAQARLGDGDAASKTVERAALLITELGSTGLNLGLVHETRARMALALGDRAEFARQVSLCKDVFTARGNPALVTKFEKLRRREAPRRMSSAVRLGAAGLTATTATGTLRLDLCSEPDARFGCALTMVMDECGASRGVMYLVGEHGPFEAASCGEADDALRRVALDCLADGMADQESTGLCESFAAGDSLEVPQEPKREHLRPVLLTHDGDEGFVVTGVVVVAVSNETPFAFPAAMAREISQHLSRKGDVAGKVLTG
ncbi:MAG TPA: protein kinase [Polyangiaceae bacterium]|nr:protein kinase [Polyangiaceae bacterium]